MLRWLDILISLIRTLSRHVNRTEPLQFTEQIITSPGRRRILLYRTDTPILIHLLIVIIMQFVHIFDFLAAVVLLTILLF